MSDSFQIHGLHSPWNSPGQNTGVGSLPLLQGIFPTQGLNPGLPHCKWILYQLSRKGRTRILGWVAYPFSKGSSRPTDQTRVSCIAGGFYQLIYQGNLGQLLSFLGRLVIFSKILSQTFITEFSFSSVVVLSVDYPKFSKYLFFFLTCKQQFIFSTSFPLFAASFSRLGLPGGSEVKNPPAVQEMQEMTV